jgi:hypothetical protein
MAERILILKSGACGWARCVFCGYGRIAGAFPVPAALNREFDRFFSEVSPGDVVKVYGSGSFLDARQVPPQSRAHFIELSRAKGIGALKIESRPEYITDEALKEFSGIDLTVAIGLETADDALLHKINKGFTLADYEKATAVIHAAGAKVRTYLLANPPHAKDIKEELERSAEYALKRSDSVVLINLLPHGNTPLFGMWLRGEWNFLSRKGFSDLTGKWKNDPRVDLDVETFRFTPKFPKEARADLRGVGEEYLTHPHFEVWQDYLQRWYMPPEEKDILLFLPCSKTKPYSSSMTHRGIIETIRKTDKYARIHQVMLSNTGVVPREFEDVYPFNAYDWDEKLETEEIKRRYVEVTESRIRRYLTVHKDNYNTVLCFMKHSSESYQALTKACSELGIECTNLLGKGTYDSLKDDGRPLQRAEALEDLYLGLKNESNSRN